MSDFEKCSKRQCNCGLARGSHDAIFGNGGDKQPKAKRNERYLGRYLLIRRIKRNFLISC